MTRLSGCERVAAALSLALCLLAASCRHFDICGTDAMPCELRRSDGGGSAEAAAAGPPGAGGDEAGAGAGGAPFEGSAGAPTGTSCTAPRADCDGSTLTVCETDISTSPLHCGDCGRSCAGMCAAGACTPFEVMSSELYDASETMAFGRNFVFFAARPTLGLVREDVLRLDLETDQVRVAASQAFSEVDQLLSVGTRLYVRADGALWSMDFDAEDLRKEGTDPGPLAGFDNELYFADNDAVYRWQGPTAAALIADLRPHSPLLMGDAGLLVVGSNDGVDDESSYWVHELRAPESTLTLLDSGVGRVRAVMAASGRAFWLLDGALDEPLRLASNVAGGISVELPVAKELDSVTIAGDELVLAWSRGRRHWLRLVPLVAPEEAVQFEIRSAPRALHYWEDELWFYDTSQLSLVRASPSTLYRLGRR